MPKDFYETLGVSRDVSSDDIKKAYRKLSKEWHPDKHKGDKDAETKFKEINEAYETLSDPKKKQMYDQFGSTKGPGGFGGFDFSGFNAENMGGIGDIFSQFFGGGFGQRGPRQERGRDLEVAVEIPFAEVVTGVKKKININRLVKCGECGGDGTAKDSKLIDCSECGGTGQITKTAQSILGTVQQTVLCPTCRGSGKVPEKPCGKCNGEGRAHDASTLTVDIPAGIHDGQTLRVTGQGEAGRQGTPAGTLYVHIRVMHDPKFPRDGDDIRTEVTIPVVDAILGTEVPIKTVHGDVTLKIPAGTQSGQVMRIKGKGLPVLSSGRHGDHFVTVTVEIPKKLSKKEKQIIEEWRGM